jgi:hypothetical protein
MRLFARAGLALVLSLAAIGMVPSPAQADPIADFPFCQFNIPDLGSAGYNESVNGWLYPVKVTVGWQYVGGSSSACEDINIQSDGNNGFFWSSGYVKVRTYMCNSSGSCWYNAWRQCNYGCTAATSMLNGTRYQVHVVGDFNVGHRAELRD